MKPVIRYVISDVHMGLSFDGLTEVIREYKRKNKLFAETLRTNGGLVLFVNHAKDKAKLYGEDGDVMGYLRMPRGRVISEETIDLIPKTFGGSVEYSRATKAALKDFLGKEKASARIRPIDKTRLHAEAV